MAEPDHILEQIRAATRWGNVWRLSDDAYLLTLDNRQRNRVEGLESNGEMVYLSHQNLFHIPICIRITYEEGHQFEYWTLNQRLHRDGDKPAYIKYSPNGDYRREWYQNGLMHRDSGPAYEKATKYQIAVQPDTSGAQIDVHSCEELEQKWFWRGTRKNQTGGPITVLFKDYTKSYLAEIPTNFILPAVNADAIDLVYSDLDLKFKPPTDLTATKVSLRGYQKFCQDGTCSPGLVGNIYCDWYLNRNLIMSIGNIGNNQSSMSDWLIKYIWTKFEPRMFETPFLNAPEDMITVAEQIGHLHEISQSS